MVLGVVLGDGSHVHGSVYTTTPRLSTTASSLSSSMEYPEPLIYEFDMSASFGIE
jgi:hypothetical protein